MDDYSNNSIAPSPEDTEDFILSCRYGDIDDLKSFVERFGTDSVGNARDENGNTVLHMASANGHTELLDVLLPIVPSTLLSAQNHAGSTALHWAALNAQLGTARALIGFPAGPGADLIDIKNSAGRSPLGEAEAAGWDEGAKWMVEVMRLDDAGAAVGEEEGAEAQKEVRDADGRVAHASLPAAFDMPDGGGEPASS
ncbi:ankyrin repeat-containing domain protein [Lactarius akahatsu]|uniref:Ankyrin repeat-containing domain protein n=1 Tax=Lactarius akahatsu TaxID=416441 RepID=A0AAD4LKU0_9AGAM|nr:ankyrin repeat-containing domain protein [Lactarius akahatsu]